MNNASSGQIEYTEETVYSIRDFWKHGKFNDEVIKLLRYKRKSCHLTAATLAMILGVSSQTIINWEHGLCARCGKEHRRRIVRLLLGQMDSLVLPQKTASPLFKKTSETVHERILKVNRFRKSIEEIVKLFHIVLVSPRLADTILKRLENLNGFAIRSIQKYTEKHPDFSIKENGSADA